MIIKLKRNERDMILKHYCWIFKKVLTPRFCNDLIKIGNKQKDYIGWTGTYNKNMSEKNLKDLKKTRDSNVTWMEGSWIYKEIHPYIHRANVNAGWNFDWDWSEPCQFTKYNLNQHYDWHKDGWTKPYNAPNDLTRHNKIRKLSVTVSLSNPKDYEGGELELNNNSMETKKKNKFIKFNNVPKGSVIVFPSFVEHRVKPVTRGKRYSLVIWSLGRSFR